MNQRHSTKAERGKFLFNGEIDTSLPAFLQLEGIPGYVFAMLEDRAVHVDIICRVDEQFLETAVAQRGTYRGLVNVRFRNSVRGEMMNDAGKYMNNRIGENRSNISTLIDFYTDKAKLYPGHPMLGFLLFRDLDRMRAYTSPDELLSLIEMLEYDAYFSEHATFIQDFEERLKNDKFKSAIPSMSLLNAHGNAVALDTLQAKLILFTFRDLDDPSMEQRNKALMRFCSRAADDGFRAVVITKVETPQQLAAWEAHALDHTVPGVVHFRDKGDTFYDAFGLSDEATNILLDGRGRILGTKVGYDAITAQLYPSTGIPANATRRRVN